MKKLIALAVQYMNRFRCSFAVALMLAVSTIAARATEDPADPSTMITGLTTKFGLFAALAMTVTVFFILRGWLKRAK